MPDTELFIDFAQKVLRELQTMNARMETLDHKITTIEAIMRIAKQIEDFYPDENI